MVEVEFEQCWETSSRHLREAAEVLSGGKQVVFKATASASSAYSVLQPCASAVRPRPKHTRVPAVSARSPAGTVS